MLRDCIKALESGALPLAQTVDELPRWTLPSRDVRDIRRAYPDGNTALCLCAPAMPWVLLPLPGHQCLIDKLKLHPGTASLALSMLLATP